MENVTLTVLKGRVRMVEENGYDSVLNEGETTIVSNKLFHRVHVISDTVSCYMYAYYNRTYAQNSRSSANTIETKNKTQHRGITYSIRLIVVAIFDILKDLM